MAQTLWDHLEASKTNSVYEEGSDPLPVDGRHEKKNEKDCAGAGALSPFRTHPTESIQERVDKDRSRHRVLKRLRGSGHWLTLLRVARTIPQPFTLNDISVAVWKACPEFFGMKGYPYPDNHKVHFILYGQRGLIAKGLIRRVDEGVFRVPEEVDPDALARSHGQAAAENRAE